MNDWKLHDSVDTIKEFFGVKRHGHHLGSVYAIEYGMYLKIGSTSNAYVRMQSLAAAAKNYGKMNVGKMFISPLHTNYKENEKLLHRKFKSFHLRAELFQLSLDQVLGEVKGIILLDESEKLDRQANDVASMMIGFVKGENPLLRRGDSK